MRCFDWRTNHVFVNNVEITGYGKGDDSLKASRLSDLASHEIGIDGTMNISLSADKSGEVILKLMAASPSNAMLNKLAAGMDNIETFLPVSVRWVDTYRGDSAQTSFGYIKKPVDISRGGKMVEQEWTIVVERLDTILGAPTFGGLPTQIAEGA